MNKPKKIADCHSERTQPSALPALRSFGEGGSAVEGEESIELHREALRQLRTKNPVLSVPVLSATKGVEESKLNTTCPGGSIKHIPPGGSIKHIPPGGSIKHIPPGGIVKRSLAMVFPCHSELSHRHCEACNAGRGNLTVIPAKRFHQMLVPVKAGIQYKILSEAKSRLVGVKLLRPAHAPIQSVIPTGVLRSLDEAGRSGGIYSKSSAKRFLNFALYVLHFAFPKAALAKALLLMAVMIIPLASCTLYRPVVGETGHYYINPYADFATVGKIVVFEFDNLSTRPELSTNLTEAITEAIRKRHLFSLSTLYRAESAWRKLDLNGSSSYSLEELSVIRQQLKADAVLFGRITRYYPYPHLLVALHLKLVDLRNGKLLWATEQVWDSTDKKVERRMRLYFNTRMRAGFQPLDWELLITSPRAFNNFVASEVAQTLPRANHYMKRRPASENVRRPAASATISKKTLQIPQKTLKFSPELAKIGVSVTL